MMPPNPLKRIDINANLIVLSALHIGSGDTYQSEAGIDAMVASVQRGGDCEVPYIPGTTLKGALRATADDVKVSLRDELFGVISESGSGSMGALIVRGAMQKTRGDTSGLPFAKDGVFVSARTAIDDGTGVADPNKLFFSEAVAPEAMFPIRLRLETRGDIDQMKTELLAILSVWAAPKGISLGADQASGLGRVRLSSEVEVVKWGVMHKGDLKTLPKEMLQLQFNVDATCPSHKMKLFCVGPYLSRDPAWTASAREQAHGEQPPHTRSLRRHKLPYLTGTSISGALRARLEWLEKLESLKDDVTLPKSVEFLSHKEMVHALRPSERLFGVSGWRGLLCVSVVKVAITGTSETTSVKMDRFSGAPIDNALFSTNLDYGVTAEIELTLDRRATKEDETVLKDLLSEIASNGLQLGHGVNHGFGWFEVMK